MATLQQQLTDLRRRLDALPPDARAAEIAPLEAEARTLLTASKNTPHESEAKTLFAELARRSASPAPESAAVRGLLRRARIRMEIAADDDDFDEAIDILAEALAQDPDNPDTLALLQQAGQRSSQLGLKVRDLLTRYGINQPEPAEPPSDGSEARGVVPASVQVQSAPPALPPAASSGPADTALAEISQAYYAGDYQKAIDLANRLLAAQPDNATALDYRQKAEDNLVRGIVPDHRIPFDARVAYNRANSLVRAGNYDEAERLYREARELAERAGIVSWKDAEQALLDIQDLSLARELLSDGDRLLAGDDWQGAIRKYEGALRVVPSDPMARERIELVRHVQEQYDKAAVQLNNLSGTLPERAASLQLLINTLSTLQQTLPGSARLQNMTQDANRRLQAVKAQLVDQGNAALTRAESASVLEEKARLVGEAVTALTAASGIDPTDLEVSATLQSARQTEARLHESRQIIERASALIAQNFDNELSQARAMLAGLRDCAQDPRYRMVVSDLLARHQERVEAAIDRRDVAAAERWLGLAKEEPFKILGRRSELLQLEEEVRNLQRNRAVRGGIIIGGVIITLLALTLATRPLWTPIINPPTATVTPTPSATPTITRTWTPTATETPTPTETPTETPTYTFTPSRTPTRTRTPTDTPTPTETPTPSDTPTITNTPTITLTPSETFTPTISPTPPILCAVAVLRDPVAVRVKPSPVSDMLTLAKPNQRMDVMEQRVGDDNRVWFRVQFPLNSLIIQGWVRADLVTQISNCPPFQ
jgi:tetratricopeptide (TPR) repeat protein